MNGHTILPAVGAAIFVMGCIAFDLRHNLYRLLTGRSVVLVSVLYWYLLEAVRLPKDLEQYSQDEYSYGLLCVVLSVVAFLIAYHGSRVSLFAALGRRMPLLNNPRVVWYLALSAMTIGFVSLLIYVNFNVLAFFEGLTGMSQRWTGGIERGRYGSWRTIFYELQTFLWAAVPLAICLLFMRRVPLSQRVVVALFIAWMFLRTLFQGARSPLMLFFVPAAAAIFWTAGPRLRRALLVFGVPIGLVAGYFLSAVIVAGRNEGRFDTKDALNVDYVGVEMFRELLFVVRTQSHGMAPQYGTTYFTQLVNPIPRAIWPGKPVADAGLIMARAYGAVDSKGEPFMTVSPGFLGEAYLNFGFLGVLIVPALAGLIVRSWDRLLPLAATSQPALLVYAAGLPTIMASSRSFNFSNYYGLISLFLLLCICDRFMRSRKSPQSGYAKFRRPSAHQARALVQARAAGAGRRIDDRTLNKADDRPAAALR
jgi:oligosaccharide repeat unit polymerase